MRNSKLQLRDLMSAHRDDETGQALVELAFTLPLLVLLLLGAAELGRVAYAAIEVSNAARAGVQYAAMNGGAYTDTTGIANAAASDAGNLSSLTTTASYTCICSNGSAPTASCATAGICYSSHVITTVTVQTQTTFDPLIHLPGLSNTFKLYGQAIQQVLQ